MLSKNNLSRDLYTEVIQSVRLFSIFKVDSTTTPKTLQLGKAPDTTNANEEEQLEGLLKDGSSDAFRHKELSTKLHFVEIL